MYSFLNIKKKNTWIVTCIFVGILTAHSIYAPYVK